jgi:hypothetical protein
MRSMMGLLVLLVACDGKDGGGDNGGGDDTADTGDTGSALDAVCTEPVAPGCVDEMILDLSLHDDKTSEGEVTTTTDGADFLTDIDASAGGYNQYQNNAWVYVRFDADGAHRVDIDDETALESMDWDMALRRYIVRLNGGDSGPSCVGAAEMRGYTYAELTSIPDGIGYQVDDFYTDSCVITEDTSGLPGSPAVAMGGWWEYPGCVETTETPFLIQKADGHILKLVVLAYYGDEQADCNDDGSTTADGGYYTLRWTFMN